MYSCEGTKSQDFIPISDTDSVDHIKVVSYIKAKYGYTIPLKIIVA
jgi:hypothetical protein